MAPEVLESQPENDEKNFEDMTLGEKEEWATNFLRERGFSVSGGKRGEGKEDAMTRAWRGGSGKPRSHRSGKHH